MPLAVLGQHIDAQEVWLPDNPRRIQFARTLVFGVSDSVGSLAMIWPPAIPYIFPVDPHPIEIVSDNVADDFGTGSGAHSVTIFGLDQDFKAIHESFALDGTTPVVSTTSYMRVNSFQVTSVGTPATANVGRISLTHQVTGDLLQTIEPGIGAAQLAVYTSPADFQVFFHSFKILVGDDSPSLNVRVKFQTNDSPLVSPSFPPAVTAQEWSNLGPGIPLLSDFLNTVYSPPQTDIWFEAEKNFEPGMANGTVSISMDIVQFPVNALRF